MTASQEDIVPLILAGGKGTRIAGLFPDIPKPAIPVAGKPFLTWILSQLHHAGFHKVVVSGGHLFAVLKEKISPHIPDGMEVIWVQEKTPLGTGGGVIYAVANSGLHPKHWLIMNGDSYLGGNWASQARPRGHGDAYLVARKVEETGRFGRLEVVEGALRKFQEKQGGGPGLINAGIYFFPHVWLNKEVSGQPKSVETDLIPGWIASGKKIHVTVMDTPFLDIGTPDDFQKAESLFR